MKNSNKKKNLFKSINLSKKEKNLLTILLILLIIYLFYTFIYTPQSEKIENLKQEELAKKTRYTSLMDKINSEGNMDLKIEELKIKLLPIASTYFGNINQEETIVLLDNFGRKANLDITSIKFTEPTKISIEDLKNKTIEEEGGVVPAATTQPATTQPATEGTTGEQNEVVEEVKVDNFTIRPVEIAFEGDYKKLMDYLTEVGSYYKAIDSYAMQVVSDIDKPLAGNMAMNFYCIDKVDKYVTQDSSILENDFIPRSTKSSPFQNYSWSYAVIDMPSIFTQGSGQGGVLVPGELGLLNPSERNIYNIPQQIRQEEITMNKTVELGSKNLTPLAFNIFDEQNLYGFEDKEIKTFVLDKINEVTGKSEKDMYSITYNFKSKESETEVYLHLDNKNIIIEKQPKYLSLYLLADKMIDNTIGTIITDANGMDHRIFMSSKVDWTNAKEIRGILPEGLDYPVKIKNIFVRDNLNSRTKNSKLSFDELKAVYIK